MILLNVFTVGKQYKYARPHNDTGNITHNKKKKKSEPLRNHPLRFAVHCLLSKLKWVKNVSFA